VAVAKRETKDVRLCGDYKVTINPVLREDKYLLPRIEDIFAKMAGGKKFSKIYLKNAYLQMEVEEDSNKYLTINTHKCLFKYNRLQFGIKTAPSIWQRVLPTVSASSEKTVELLRDVFARYGLPEHLHSDNGSQFTSEVFRNFMKANNIRHTFFAPYHPATNGQVERFVQTFKQAMRSARGDSV
ncbi:hypothetical protein LSAT2_004663, partial [Lamellibrachia satsuma]